MFPLFPTEIAALFHYVETNGIFLPSGRIGPSPFTKMNKVEIFLLETLFLQIGFMLPRDLFNTMYRDWEQTIYYRELF